MRKWFLVIALAVAAQKGFPADSKSGSGGFLDRLFGRKPPSTNTTTSATTTTNVPGLSVLQMNGGVKEALEAGLQTAVARLGQTNGFLTNAQVRIPVPQQLAFAEQMLRTLKQDALINQFEVAMNRAAEKAVPAATPVFVNAVKQMSIQDAARLLTSQTNTAITEYFRSNTSTQLVAKFLPLVKEATANAGVTSTYNQFIVKSSIARNPLLAQHLPDVDHYVAEKALDGLFKMVGEEEQRIRANPQARTTELLQKVFGMVQSAK